MRSSNEPGEGHVALGLLGRVVKVAMVGLVDDLLFSSF